MRAVRLSESGTTLDNVFIRLEAGLPLDESGGAGSDDAAALTFLQNTHDPNVRWLPFGFQNNRRARRPRAIVR